MWHVTCDVWHVTCDTWHVTRDMWHVTCCGGWTFSQNFSSLALTVCDLWYYEDLEEKAHSLTHLINYEAVCRTAPATPGLLITTWLIFIVLVLPGPGYWKTFLFVIPPSMLHGTRECVPKNSAQGILYDIYCDKWLAYSDQKNHSLEWHLAEGASSAWKVFPV